MFCLISVIYKKTVPLSIPNGKHFPNIHSMYYEKKIKTVMINNFTNINKRHNHRLPQAIEHNKRLRFMALEIYVLA